MHVTFDWLELAVGGVYPKSGPLKIELFTDSLEDLMKRLKLCVTVALIGTGIAGASQKAKAQVSINIGVGAPVAVAPVAVAPVCPYGYFNYEPYGCAPFGYYGPQWFVGGVFIGAGPWFHGPVGFHGYVDRDFDPRYGYRGYCPHRGERPDWGRHVGWEKHFRGNEEHEERWHDNGHHYGQYKHENDQGEDHGNRHGHGHGHDRD